MNDHIDTPPWVSSVLREVDGVKETARDNDKRAEQRTHDLREEMVEKLDALLAEARKTNGRITRAEMWIERIKGVFVLFAFLVPFAIWFLTTFTK